MGAYPSQLQAAAEPIIIQAVEHGFMHHYVRSCVAALAYESVVVDGSNDSSDYADSTLGDLVLLFYGLLIGHIIALMVFVLEFVFSYNRI